MSVHNTNRTFNFPFITDENDLNYKENPKTQTLFSGDFSSYEWYKVIVSNCLWKATDALVVIFLLI